MKKVGLLGPPEGVWASVPGRLSDFVFGEEAVLDLLHLEAAGLLVIFREATLPGKGMSSVSQALGGGGLPYLLWVGVQAGQEWELPSVEA